MNNAWTFFIKRRVVAWVIIAGIIITGVFSAISIPKESFPEVEFPMVMVSSVLPGATPSDTEDLLTKPLEKEIAPISGISVLQSTSSFSFSTVFVEFEADQDVDEAIDKVKEAVDRAKTKLPDEATDPQIIKFDLSEISVITYSLISDTAVIDLSEIAEEVQAELEQVSGISRVSISGDLKKEVHVIVNQSKLENAGLTITDISNAIKFGNLNLPAGAIEIDKSAYSLRFENEITNPQELGEIIIGSNLQLKDLARIETGTTSKQTLSRLSNQGDEPKNAVSLTVVKKKGGNTIKIVEALDAKLEELKANRTIPEGTQVLVTNDNAQFIKRDLGTLTQNGITTIFIIIGILFLAIGLREGIIAGMAIPLTFLISFSILYFKGETLNGLTLFSLVISLGLLVDTAIVVMEGIYEGINEGLNRKDAAIKSIETFRWPLIAGTATTVFAFFPMLLVGGIMGEYLKTMPITISGTLIGSLFVSLFLIPAIATKFLRKNNAGQKKALIAPIVNFMKNIQKNYLTKLLYSRAKRFVLMFTILIAFVASMALPMTGALSTEMFTEFDADYFIIDIELQPGTILEETDKYVKQVEDYLREQDEVINFVSIVGSAQTQALTDMGEMNSVNMSSNIANITVNLSPADQREIASYEIADPIREELKVLIPEPEISVRELKDGPPTDAAIAVKISGADMEILKELATKVETLVNNTEGTTEVKNSLEKGLNEFVFNLDQNKLAFHGLAEAQVVMVIRGAIQGEDAGELAINEEDVDIVVKYDDNNLDLTELQSIQIPSPRGHMVSLNQLGTYSLGESLSNIVREDQERMVKVLGEVKPGFNAVVITQEITEKIEDIEVPSGYTVSFGGDYQQVQQSFNELFMAMIVGILLIALTLVLQFNSFKQCFIILFTLPLALIGVFPGLMLIGMNLSFSAFIGVVALVGIVVNDAIVLISQINRNRSKGELSFEDSIIDAAYHRFQPVLLTTITTIFGILPVALIDDQWGGVGYSIIFGLLAATVLTLLVIPVMYYTLERKKAMKETTTINQ
ncbi:efflux RND transporter permease subunit [Candidatus Peregrinibacteria bacterium]|jgi:multidrug efflux pump subunit AcrB|nr:efflux RND transporter permease subunit [Candidatus Peregrinibacteria bacterium]MBT4147814.1 efflux RND transporter permease subunit [Candidatus Peregrinibacteria bacterium]MBT4365832.1 efflux RND transporter permease subunit [Candidatus Peregrinibacteria bacterium]MBT4455681.1 efflux RND transporter permease subunit [Candidatus Peregrinibacteria bacterium]